VICRVLYLLSLSSPVLLLLLCHRIEVARMAYEGVPNGGCGTLLLWTCRAEHGHVGKERPLSSHSADHSLLFRSQQAVLVFPFGLCWHAWCLENSPFHSASSRKHAGTILLLSLIWQAMLHASFHSLALHSATLEECEASRLYTWLPISCTCLLRHWYSSSE